jgi:hypothetical protein
MSKFIEEISTNKWEIETPTGWQSFDGIGKTIEYQEWIICTENNKILICADKHIFLDHKWNEIFCDELQIGDLIQTEDGLEKVISIEITENNSNMYDLLNVENGNIFYSNGIVSHNSTTCVSYLLHYAVFNDNVNIAILANKASTAKDLLGRLQLAYENLPKWMQQGIVSWNKQSLELENGSKIIAASTSASAVRGGSYNIIFLDEFAFIPNNIADQFFASVYPTISSGKSTKVIIVSTPHGMNHFYRMWHDAEKGKNEYVPTDVHWSEVPGRDAKWKEQTIANTNLQQFNVEFNCEFLGSVDTLINPTKLKSLVYEDPLKRSKGLDVYEDPKEDNNYLITVDVARGVGSDYSAFIVFDITNFPYRTVAKYKNNEIKPMIFPSIIHEVAKAYNDSWLLVEVNDIGDQVANILHYDL